MTTEKDKAPILWLVGDSHVCVCVCVSVKYLPHLGRGSGDILLDIKIENEQIKGNTGNI